MACDDGIKREFMNIPSGATYELSVDAPPGSTAFADFADGAAADFVRWPRKEIAPGPKQQTLTGKKLKAVYITVVIDPKKEVDVTVKASVGDKKYCRTVKGSAKNQEVIVHYLRMEK